MPKQTLREILGIIFFLLILPIEVMAGPVSPHYELKTYSFGAGGLGNASDSAGVQMNANVGDLNGQPLNSDRYKVQPGLNFTQQANLPPAPTLTNPGSAYNRLKLIIATGGNPTDATYSIAVTTDNWVSTKYIQSDATIGDTLGNEDWQTYDNWGSAAGRYITGLQGSTYYKVKVKARAGKFTETAWSDEAGAATAAPSLTFGVSNNELTFDILLPENSWTDSSKSTILTTSTNAYNGYAVYGHETAPLTYGTHTIADYGSPNADPTTWSGTGFGYSTNDNSLIGGDADRFTNGGPKYAGFTSAIPGDPVADHIGPIVETPISNEQFTVSYRVTASANHVAGKYTNTVLYIAVPVY
jgi:hypothetical protein